jgi:hypothetical protein
MSEGTISYFIGCHHFFLHPLFVLIAWVKEYRSWPDFYELCCIFLHDIGHLGKQYLSDPAQKAEHWKLGASIAGQLFGAKGFLLVAGHSKNSGYPRSKLFIPDKKSWIVAPGWWLRSNSWFENFGSAFTEPGRWKALCIENAANGFPKGSHEMYLEHKDCSRRG